MFKALLAFLTLSFTFVAVAFGAWNGNPLKNPQQFNPSVVSIQMIKGGGTEFGICTGTFFHDMTVKGQRVGFVITAGHCVVGAETIDVVFQPDSNESKPLHLRTTKLWVRHEKLLEPDNNGQTFMGDINAHEIHDVAIIMVDNVPPHVKPLSILYGFKPDRNDILYILSRKEEDKLTKAISPFVSVPISNINHLTMNGSTDMKVPGTSLLFEAKVIQSSSKNKFRGICPGDSGGAVVAYHEGKPYVIGTLSAMYDTFPITHDRVCGRQVLFYGVSFNRPWIEKAIEHLLAQAAL